MLKALLKDSAVYAIPSLVSRGLSLFLVPLYTRVLMPQDYGVLDLFMVFAGIVNLTIALEVSQAVALYYSSESDRQKKISYASSAFWFTLGCYLSFAILAYVFVKPVSRLVMGRSGLEDIFGIGLLHILFYGMLSLMKNQLRWELRSKIHAILSLTHAIITAVLSVWLAYSLNMGLVGLMWGMAGGSSAAVLLGSWQLHKTFRWYFSRKLLSKMLRFSAPLVPAGIAVWVSSYVDRIMISYYLGFEELGLYSVGFRLASIVSLVMVGFQMALTPLIYAHHENPQTPGEIARIFRLFLAFCLLLFSGLNLFAYDLLVLFTQPAYYDAYKVVVFLVPSIILSQMYIFAPGIFIGKKTGFVVWINVTGASINALFNWILIPMMGFTGAALATMLAQGIVFGLYVYFSQNYYPINYAWRKCGVAILLVIIILGVVNVISTYGVLRYSISILTMLLVLLSFFLAGLVTKPEIASIFSMIIKRIDRAK